MLSYNVEVHTGKKSGAGTDANVFLDIFGEQGDTGERPLSKSKTNRNKFEKGNVSRCNTMSQYLYAFSFHFVDFEENKGSVAVCV